MLARVLHVDIEQREGPRHGVELGGGVRVQAERSFEQELRVAVLLDQPRGDDVGLEELRDFLENFTRHLVDIEPVDQRPGNLVQDGLALECETLRQVTFHLADGVVVSLHPLDEQVRFGGGKA